MVSYIFAYTLFGVVVGLVFGVAFTVANKKWKKGVESTLIVAITFGMLGYANSYYSIEKELLAITSVFYFLGFLVAFLITFLGICYLIKSQRNEDAKIRVLDIVLGYSESLTSYFHSRKKEIDEFLSVEEIKQKTEELNAKEACLNAINKDLERKDAELKEQIRIGNHLKMRLPIHSEELVTSGFVEKIPVYTENYAQFCVKVSKLTQEFIDGVENKTRRKSKNEKLRIQQQLSEDLWVGFFTALCKEINGTLFDTHTEMVRTHIRILKDDEYISLLSLKGNDEIERELTPIPKERGMICAAHSNRSSLVKSLNPTLHHKGKNDSTWCDYITFTLEGIEEDGYPVFSIGVSVSNAAQYRELLYYVNYLRVERVINTAVKKINRVCGIDHFVTKWRENNDQI